jgi:hypothetical protein
MLAAALLNTPARVTPLCLHVRDDDGIVVVEVE